MALDPGIISHFVDTQVPPPQTILQSVGEMMKNKDLASQIALRNYQGQQWQATTQGQQLENQQKQNTLRSQSALQDALSDPAARKEIVSGIVSGDYSPIYKRNISPDVATGFIQQIQKMSDAQQGLEKNRIQLHNDARAALADTLQGLDPNDDDVAASQWDGARQKLAQNYPELANLPPAPPGPNFRDQIKNLAAINDVSQTIADTQAKLAQTRADTSQHIAQANEAQSTADLDAARKPGAVAESTKQQLIAQAMQRAQSAQASGQHPIDAILGQLDPRAAAAYKPAYDTAMANGGPDAAKAILEAAASHAGQISTALNPAIQQQKVNEAVATESALTPLKIQQAVQTEIQKAQQAPGAFSSVIDPGMRSKAVSDFEKSSQDYADKVGAAAQLADFVKAAQSGNKAAPGLIPITEVRQLVNRVNRQELESVSAAAGSAYDRLQGFVNKYTEGQPIPPEILKDTAAISQTMQNAAQRTYGMKVAANRQIYGSKVQPIDLNQASGAGNAPAAGGQVTVTDPRGVVHTFPSQAQADAFKKAAGIQ